MTERFCVRLIRKPPFERTECELYPMPEPLCYGIFISTKSSSQLIQHAQIVNRPRDQRRMHVSLTPRSRALAAKMSPRIEAVYAGIEERLGRKFADGFYRALDEMIVKLKPEAGPTPPAMP